MKKLLTVIILLLSIKLFAQLNVVSTTPADGTVNVTTNTTLTITFDSKVDTTFSVQFLDHFFTNVDSISAITLSGDSLSLNFNLELTADRYYYFLLNSAKNVAGDFLAAPYLVEFTTASSFSGVTVSGTVSTNSTQYTPENSLIALSLTPIGDNEPLIAFAAIADAQGNYTVNHVADGKYYPVAVKDVAAGPGISPELGDLFGVVDSIIVSGSPLTGIDIEMLVPSPITLMKAIHQADSLLNAGGFPNDVELRFIDSWQVDSTGSAIGWHMNYYSPSKDSSYEVDIDFFEKDVTPLDLQSNNWISSMATIDTTGMIDPAVFLANCDADGGKDMRDNTPDSLRFMINLTIAQLNQTDYWSLVNDDSVYIGASYLYVKIINQDSIRVDSSMSFAGNLKTGDIVIVGVEDNIKGGIPEKYSLSQNYPNPFNPSTTIKYFIPQNSIVKLEVFNLIGQKIATLFNNIQTAGEHEYKWTPNLSSGVYFYRLEAIAVDGKNNTFVQTKKMILMK